MKKITLIIFLGFIFINLFSLRVYAKENNSEIKKAHVINIEKSSGSKVKVRIKYLTGIEKGKEADIFMDDKMTKQALQVKKGDKVLIGYMEGKNGKEPYIKDFVRTDGLIILTIIFILLVIFIAKKHGITSLISMLITFIVINNSILPNILAGSHPVLAVMLAGLFMIPITFYLSHGLNKKTTIAILGSLISLMISGILAIVSVEIVKLTGFASEEANFLNVIQGNLPVRDILLAGIIVGLFGILDDVTVSQASVVSELRLANKNYTQSQLFSSAMKIGNDHISSLVNTLVLVYAGASFPLFLLFSYSGLSLTEAINYEPIAEEIVRMLVGSIGLISAVPITTLLASYFYKRT